MAERSRGPVGALVPVKMLDEALGRLEDVLSATERRALQEAMLVDVLRACARAPGVEEILVVTADPDAAALSRGEGALVVSEPRRRGMNAAVAHGLTRAVAAGWQAALVLTADLPLVGPEDLGTVLAAHPPGGGVVIAPSRDGTGTNALLMTPPGALVPELGPDSLVRHRAQARRQGIPLALCPCAGLGLDIDTPADLAALIETGAGGATGDVLDALVARSTVLAAGGGP